MHLEQMMILKCINPNNLVSIKKYATQGFMNSIYKKHLSSKFYVYIAFVSVNVQMTLFNNM